MYILWDRGISYISAFKPTKDFGQILTFGAIGPVWGHWALAQWEHWVHLDLKIIIKRPGPEGPVHGLWP